MNDWVLIGLMALVTYLPRYLPLALAGRVSVPPLLENALNFVPIAVLSAIVAQAALIRGGELDVSLGNYHALSALAALVAAVVTRHLFLTIGTGLVCFLVLRVLSL
jgi:branched-subunit amino acid transport protein